MDPIILASSSPRRQEILKMMNIPFQVIMPDVNENLTTAKSPLELTESLARSKVLSVVHSLPPKQVIPWVLGADTVVALNNRIYGKPSDQDEAFEFIKSLQGKTHTVCTSIALYNGAKKTTSTRTAVTKVTFYPMSQREIEAYVETGDWHGAAGGYRIQGMASCFISKIEGSQSCVVGLPIFELYDILKSQGYSVLE
ncbi:MAG: septum formation protein Maf [Treponema sp.]|uniref:Maf family protein n=1 Tax=Treponema sp. TaxID=166 RepID=UPI001B79A048|nr:Maf family protein [Treponema sp.]MBP5402797.1 septum formation protein Maf [Treponema sp.]MBR5934502.1 septum formation protein Maf [Treponema sp.]